MGIFDRFRTAAPSGTNGVKQDTSGQNATRLIDEGHVLEAEGKLDDAMQCYLEAIRLAPNPARAHLNHGNILLLMGDLKGALDAFSTAIRHQPDYAGAYYNIGRALLGNGQLDEAAANFRRALEIQPGYAEVHCSLGVVLKDLGQLDDAVTHLQSALQINPDLVEAHFNRGLALQGLGQSENAAASFRHTLSLKPDFAEAHTNLGFVLQDIGQLEEAIASYRRALQINPALAVAHNNLGAALKEHGKFDEAAASYRRALEIEPDNAVYRVALMFNSPTAPQTEAESAAVPGDFDQSLQNLTDWILSAPQQREQISEALSLQPTFYLAYRDGNHAARLSRFGDILATYSPDAVFKSVARPAKLRLMVVSNYFHRHSVWDVILRGILVNLDRSRFEVILYSFGTLEDEETKLAQSLSDVWRDFRMVTDFNGWLDAVSKDQPDVIFYPEIGMNHMTLKLAAKRLAPLQIASWGHPVTTGLPTIDLYFSGDLLEPPDADTHYRERLVRLPGTGCCTMPIELAPEKLHQLEAELATRRGTRFVIAQTPFKFDPADDALFADIAAAVGECTFILFDLPKFSWAMEQLMVRLNRAFRERNLDPEQHLLVIPWLPREKFYALLDMSDIFLDCPSFSGYTTAWQALQRGLPVVTLEGKFMRQRLAAGLLRKIGMTDTIAASKDDYVAIAVRLAAECRDPVRRAFRYNELKAAASQADHDIGVVRAFEQTVIDALAERGRHFEFGTAGTTLTHPKDHVRPTSPFPFLSAPIPDNITGDKTQNVLLPEEKIKHTIISIIFCSISETKAQYMEQHYRDLFGNEPHEIIVIRDARSLAEAYNRGIDRAIGDVLIFSHDDIEFLDPATWLTRLKTHLINFDIVGLAGTTQLISSAWAQAGPPYTFGQVAELDNRTAPYRVLLCSVPAPVVPGIQGLDGLFFAVKRKVVNRIRFDETTFDGFHCYDTDFSHQAYLAGFKLAVATDLYVLHSSQGNFDKKWEFYAQRFMDKHRANLRQMPKRIFQHALVMAQNKKEIIEIMTPPRL